MLLPFIRVASTAAFLVAGATASGATPVAPAKRVAPAAVSAVASGDVTPPVLTAFDTAAVVDVNVPMNPLIVSFKASDDLSGVSHGYAVADGPNGRTVHVHFSTRVPVAKLSGKMFSDDYSGLSPFVEPGDYRFTKAVVVDAAGNFSNIDLDQTPLGRTAFKVKNTKGFDAVGPTLLSGTVIQSGGSLSGYHPGTSARPYVGISIQAADSGNPVISGVWHAVAFYCMPAGGACMRLESEAEGPLRQKSATLRVGRQLDPATDAPGEYRLTHLDITDHAYNETRLMSAEIGGETDFSQYFKSTVLTVAP